MNKFRMLAAGAAAALFVNLAGAQSGHQHGDGDHHPRANAPLMAFHELMEPLWHSPPGAETNARACRIADEIGRRAKAAAERPTADHAALVRSAKTLHESCNQRNEAEVTNELNRLHSIFHTLAGQAG